jgi:Camelysin metallo-endopeptidase
MAVRPKLMIGAGIAVAGLGLIGAGAGATFTTQVSANTSISSGDLGLSLNGETGPTLLVGVGGDNLGSHFAPISKDLVLKNTGTLDMASTFLSVTATGCDGGRGEALTDALHVRLTDETNDGKLIYDGSLCSLASNKTLARSESGQGFTTPPAHADVGGQLPHTLGAGESIHYRLVIQPDDAEQGLPTAAQDSRTSVNLVFSGFDY